MKNFNLEIFEGHPIISDNENIILVDTGAPSTIHKSNTLTFITDEYNVVSNYMGIDINKISEMLGKDITALLGADIISQYKILIDYHNKNIVFDKDNIDFIGNEMKISSFMGIPIIELIIKQINYKFFLDTGAKLSYLSDSITNDFESIGMEEDFYPGVGSFKTNCYEIITNIENMPFNVRYGNLPELLQMTLMLGGTDGIIGYDFFNNFKVMIDLENERLKYSK